MHRSPISLLVHGTHEVAVCSVAVGFALRSSGSFAWADCAAARRAEGKAAHRILGRGSERPVVDRLDESLLRTPRWTRQSLDGLFLPPSPGFAARFESFLRMPELYQRLIAHATPRDGRSAIVLANVHAIPGAYRANVVDRPELHAAIHDQGVTLLATSRPAPAPETVGVFDQVLRVDVPARGGLADGCLMVEKGNVPELTVDPAPLWKAWSLLGLEPGLLPS